ncbi:hypothetical protein EDB83DRAFT_1958874 [Lactarius deliciosus]|nr:hypothetical protein EDB83DRAFT_1958874 [Lactarius deliciosus]
MTVRNRRSRPKLRRSPTLANAILAVVHWHACDIKLLVPRRAARASKCSGGCIGPEHTAALVALLEARARALASYASVLSRGHWCQMLDPIMAHAGVQDRKPWLTVAAAKATLLVAVLSIRYEPPCTLARVSVYRRAVASAPPFDRYMVAASSGGPEQHRALKNLT